MMTEMKEQPEHANKEFFCSVCGNWYSCVRVGAHMQEFHNRPDPSNLRSDQRQWTLERLQEHYGQLGGLDIREVEKKTEKQIKDESWFSVK